MITNAWNLLSLFPPSLSRPCSERGGGKAILWLALARWYAFMRVGWTWLDAFEIHVGVCRQTRRQT